jgi:hypothetical protein
MVASAATGALSDQLTRSGPPARPEATQQTSGCPFYHASGAGEAYLRTLVPGEDALRLQLCRLPPLVKTSSAMVTSGPLAISHPVHGSAHPLPHSRWFARRPLCVTSA